MQWLRILHKPEKLAGTINLPASKSISNRALIIQALCRNDFQIHNLSTADDTLLMYQALYSTEKELFIKNAGTAMRFLTTYFAASDKEIVLQGSERMNERPIRKLVDALIELGAEIDFLGAEGYPPLYIRGKTLEGRKISLSPSESSQYVSALLLIAPVIRNGLTIELQGQIVSESYIEMTLKLLSWFGIQYERRNNILTVPEQPFQVKDIFIENDWSSASYWYALAGLMPGLELTLTNLTEDSWQGDSIVKQFMSGYGIDSSFSDNGILIYHNRQYQQSFQADMTNYPDLIPTMVSFCCAKGIAFNISGIQSLQYKESNRADVLVEELSKLYSIGHDGKSIYTHEGENKCPNEVYLNTYQDHRMVMSFVMQAVTNKAVWIENPAAVEKSYPRFWDDLQSLGFTFEIVDK